MIAFLSEYGMFLAKVATLVVALLFIIGGIAASASRGRHKGGEDGERGQPPQRPTGRAAPQRQRGGSEAHERADARPTRRPRGLRARRSEPLTRRHRHAGRVLEVRQLLGEQLGDLVGRFDGLVELR